MVKRSAGSVCKKWSAGPTVICQLTTEHKPGQEAAIYAADCFVSRTEGIFFHPPTSHVPQSGSKIVSWLACCVPIYTAAVTRVITLSLFFFSLKCCQNGRVTYLFFSLSYSFSQTSLKLLLFKTLTLTLSLYGLDVQHEWYLLFCTDQSSSDSLLSCILIFHNI